jgi:hypothetical protein
MSDSTIVTQATSLMSKGDWAATIWWFWGPNWVGAADYYADAAAIYLQATRLETAKEASERAAQAYCNDNSQAKGSEFYANAAKIALQLQAVGEALRLMQKSKECYLIVNQAVYTARQMRDVARQVRSLDLAVACALYDALLEVIEATEQYHWSKDRFLEYALLSMEEENGIGPKMHFSF